MPEYTASCSNNLDFMETGDDNIHLIEDDEDMYHPSVMNNIAHLKETKDPNRSTGTKNNVFVHKKEARKDGVLLGKREFTARHLSNQDGTAKDPNRIAGTKKETLLQKKEAKSEGVLLSKQERLQRIDSGNFSVPNHEGDFEKIAKGLQKSLAYSRKLSERLESDETDFSDDCTGMQFNTKLITGAVLRDYQEDGVKWLIQLNRRKLNGILADEMGLGKTLQSITFISNLITSGVSGPFLILAPLSTIHNWKSEFNKFAPSIPVILISGSKEDRLKQLKKTYVKFNVAGVGPVRSVVISAYSSFKLELKSFLQFRWSYLIFDEAAAIKNSDSQLYKKCMQLCVDGKLLLTGTPLQNDIKELWNLLHFILPKIFYDFSLFRRWIEGFQANGNDIKNTQNLQLVRMMHELLSPFFLRRTKSTVNLNLPARKNILVYCPLTDLQKKYYTDILAQIDPTIEKKTQTSPLKPRKTKLQAMRRIYGMTSYFANEKQENINDEEVQFIFHDESETKCAKPAGPRLRIGVNMVVKALMRVISHPWLAVCKFENGFYPQNEVELRTLSGKMNVLFILLKKLIANGHKVIVFSTYVMTLDLVSMLLEMNNIPHFYLSGETKLDERQSYIETFNNPMSEEKVFLISTKSGGVGINLCGADTVIFYDSDWNPQNDVQAADRCYRIGQTRNVVTYRLICKGTIDERILDVANGKRQLERLIVDCGKFEKVKSVKNLNEKDLAQILKAVDFDQCVKQPSIEEIERLADRDAVFKANSD